MAIKPSTVPLWATTAVVGVDNIEPLLAEKQPGWPAGYEPPAQWFNWWMNLVYLWVLWLQAFESTAHSWTARQTMTRGLSANGSNTGSNYGIDTSTNGLWAGLFNQGSLAGIPNQINWLGGGVQGFGTDWVLDAGAFTNSLAFRAYRESSPGVIDTGAAYLLGIVYGMFQVSAGIIAINSPGHAAVYALDATGVDGALFGQGDGAAGGVIGRNSGSGPAVDASVGNGSGAVTAENTSTGAAISAVNSGTGAALSASSSNSTKPTVDVTNSGGTAGSFAGAAGIPALQASNTGGGVALSVGTGHMKTAGATPASTDPFSNRLTPMNYPKAMVEILLNATASPTIKKGFNVASVSQDAAGIITVTFATNFADGDYLVDVLGENLPNWNWQPNYFGGRLVGSVTVVISNYAGSQIDRATSTGRHMCLWAYGDQP